MSRVDNIKEALLLIGVPVYHWTAPTNTAPEYIVYGEDSAADFVAGNHHAEQADQGTVDLYTKSDTSATVEKVVQALEDAALAWYRSSVQYEQETGLVHFEWVFEV